METEIKIKKIPIEEAISSDGRPSWDLFYLNIAESYSKRATCLRRQFGAVVVKDNEQVASGYCGAPRNLVNCTTLGKCMRQEQGIPSGKCYEMCRSVHAEQNAAIQARRTDMVGGTIYIVGKNLEETNEKGTYPYMIAMPCELCIRAILNIEQKRMVTRDENFIYAIDMVDVIKYANENPFEGLSLYGIMRSNLEEKCE